MPHQPQTESQHEHWQQHPHYYTAGEGDPGPGAHRHCSLCGQPEGSSLHTPIQLGQDVLDALYYLRVDALQAASAGDPDVLSSITIATKGPICPPPPPEGEPHEHGTLWGHTLQADPELEGATVQFRHTSTGEVIVEGQLAP